MTKTEAHTLLDAARAGADVPADAITEALVATGDLCGHAIRPFAAIDASTVRPYFLSCPMRLAA